MATDSYITGLAAELLTEHAASVQRDGHHGKIARYLAGDHDLPYIPADARREFRIMAERAITNLLPRVSDTFVKLLAVDGYRADKAAENAAAWQWWQANKLDARQTIAHRGAIEYGASYVLVLPGKASPFIRPLDPLRSMAWYEDEDDEWPVYGMRHIGQTRNGDVRWELYDSKEAHHLLIPKSGIGPDIKLIKSDGHNLGVTPFVRFRDRLDGTPTGVIKPLIIAQDRVSDIVFVLDIAMHYASFRQRWASGLAVPRDEDQMILNPNYDPDGPEDPELNPPTIANPNFGQPIESFDAAIDRLWVTDNKDARFGDFSQTQVDGHLRAYESAVTTMAVLGQMPSGMLQGNLVNVGSDALATLYDVTQRQSGVYELLFGEAWEQTFALSAIAAKTTPVTDAQIRWRNKEARNFAATVDALGKMVQMLSVPAEAAWEMIPGTTDKTIERWRAMAKSSDGLAALTEVLARQANPVTDPALNAAGNQVAAQSA